ncbi:hypothetical protein FHW69_001575 [Luteibacter sp. Sphag1AF]|uniref:hypothetical protein n=1 Tax=Luteibacter sp. Sphag1AF TaxID=2587031 RepID=UPI00160F90BC|nr:hypothetical protein [Luteibacter sp. Sphag1AF]MBB3226974.1 hypothetical protein [Luteibacter sp. Sphag1AF]
MANEKNRPPAVPGQEADAEARRKDDRNPDRQTPTDSSGDALDGTGEDNHKADRS